ncbi:Plasmid stabilization system protein [Nitrospira sp. KM1]|uniref:type II toxin-antitoxin system RelE family toxin n=1 Tax=Nitrospira sp. KM1 TaxID=1936990 RepID=UPI0013A7B2A6|nr:type II toxin-antitoxin system RelE/ParE family toxin [Nitrospira sp. KM1]BCA56446.1 Plasmid stabilization system protein [Nitrospira sp. KM1]
MTDSYKLVIKKSAERELRTIPKSDLRRITERLRGLADTPRPQGCEKLSGHDQYRIRQGDYRIIYGIDDEARIVTLVKVGHRREIYR